MLSLLKRQACCRREPQVIHETMKCGRLHRRHLCKEDRGLCTDHAHILIRLHDLHSMHERVSSLDCSHAP